MMHGLQIRASGGHGSQTRAGSGEIRYGKQIKT